MRRKLWFLIPSEVKIILVLQWYLCVFISYNIVVLVTFQFCHNKLLTSYNTKRKTTKNSEKSKFPQYI